MFNQQESDTIAPYMNVRVGSAYYKQGGTIHHVETVVNHPDHVPYSWIMDYALLMLKDSIVFSAVAQPIALASRPEDLLSDRHCVVTGWGRTLNEEESFEKLRAVEIPLVSRMLCNASYEGKIDSSMVCAGDYMNGGKGVTAGKYCLKCGKASMG
uniref:Peptidase S1 domain-containing protein n=1 Tax=Anopheles epiroticus TaxID=199890 RepID=A0A182PK69_9DIPT